jgi:hypothetical protein
VEKCLNSQTEINKIPQGAITMKTILFLLAFLFFSTKTIAQSTLIQPELFSLTNSGNTCTAATDKGKIYFNTDINKFIYCISSGTYKEPNEYWAANGSDIYYLGKVGIRNNNPTYDLDLGSDTRIQNLIVYGNVGINTTTPSEKFEVKDREISITSTADAYGWRIRNFDANDRLEFLDNGQKIMYVNYGGNITIGTSNSINTHKLYVEGDVSYAGSLSVEGKGTLSNTNANQLVMHTVTSITTGGTFNVPNAGCATASFTFPSGTFTSSPAVFLGQNLSITRLGDELVKSIINVTTSGGSIQFCNQTGGGISLNNQTFSIMAIGQ